MLLLTVSFDQGSQAVRDRALAGGFARDDMLESKNGELLGGVWADRHRGRPRQVPNSSGKRRECRPLSGKLPADDAVMRFAMQLRHMQLFSTQSGLTMNPKYF